ncbi:ADP-ribose pyrophosphatase, mitochondrial isoform X2 [Prorops nasuta]|uniref:ADP-ribose pyrophosphatase, mitochondrial isoform X2 n=1 Tax=Prorops nasuta TaxID=863751 RepID=UPI0034CED082
MRVKYFEMIHHKCRRGIYPGTKIQRFEVPEDKVFWNVDFQEYSPVDYTCPSVIDKLWADPEIRENTFQPKWNSLDAKVNRKSFMGDYVVTDNGYPLNPIGRTGIIGRGLLGRWGPNHAADPIVTRWKRNGTGALEIDKTTEKPILQFVAIQRKDTGEWAIPGGMVDPGETVSQTIRREFMEEALNSLEKQENEKQELEENISEFFKKGDEIYQGYVDDPRNTDNAWMETVAYNFHDDDGTIVGKLALTAGDDATNVRWMDVSKSLNLYANHTEFIRRTMQKRNAHW